MILTTHALVGAVIGKNIQNPWIIIILSLAFHYILDAVRHGEYVETFDNKVAFKNTWWKIVLDFSVGLAIILLVIRFKNFDAITVRNIFIGMFFSMFPDSLTLIYWKTRWKFFEKLYKFHSWCHRLPRFSPEREWKLQNEIYEIAIGLIMTVILILF
ncbi:MAG: hypothetical protein WC906_03775 [Parcubacteria group bacterium]|jgi:hypothetical protein